jgi:hypothetical protein
MITFLKWLAEDAGMVSGTYTNDELLQSKGAGSKYTPKLTKDVSPYLYLKKTPECKFLGLCPNQKPERKDPEKAEL